MYGWKRLEIIVSNICIILLDNRFTSSEHLLSLVNVDRSSLPRCSLNVIYTYKYMFIPLLGILITFCLISGLMTIS